MSVYKVSTSCVLAKRSSRRGKHVLVCFLPGPRTFPMPRGGCHFLFFSFSLFRPRPDAACHFLSFSLLFSSFLLSVSLCFSFLSDPLAPPVGSLEGKVITDGGGALAVEVSMDAV